MIHSVAQAAQEETNLSRASFFFVPATDISKLFGMVSVRISLVLLLFGMAASTVTSFGVAGATLTTDDSSPESFVKGSLGENTRLELIMLSNCVCDDTQSSDYACCVSCTQLQAGVPHTRLGAASAALKALLVTNKVCCSLWSVGAYLVVSAFGR